MKLVIAFSALLVVALAAPQSDKDAQVLKFESENIGVDGYQFNYETSNGISHLEQGTLKNAGTDNEAISVQGQFTYKTLDGQTFSVSYTADETGFHPEGAHLPKK